MRNTIGDLAQMIANHFDRDPVDDDLNLAAKILDRVNGTPRANTLPDPAAADLMTPELLHLNDITLHARLVELRDWHARHSAWYGRWIATVRQRVRRRDGEEQAAAALGISRATIRKTTPAVTSPQA